MDLILTMRKRNSFYVEFKTYAYVYLVKYVICSNYTILTFENTKIVLRTKQFLTVYTVFCTTKQHISKKLFLKTDSDDKKS